MYPLDSLRGIAAIGVAFFWHYQHFSPQNGFPFGNLAYWFYHFGAGLVDLFFVLSGFIFCYIYTDRIRSKLLTFREYAVLRLSRLYPLHLVTLIIVAILQSIYYLKLKGFYIYPYNDVYHFILNLVYLQKGWFESGFSFNGPSWSIACEIVAYLLFFMTVYKFSKNEKYKLAFMGFIFLGLSIYKLNLTNIPFFNTEIARILIGFFIGCFVYEIHLLISGSKKKNLIVLLLSFVFIGLISLAIIFGHKILGDYTIVYTVVIYPLIILLALNIKHLNMLLSIKPLTYLGDISYSIYLWHFPMQLLIVSLDKIFILNINYSSRVFFLGFACVTIAISALSYELFEKPFSKYLRLRLLNNHTGNAELKKEVTRI